MNQLYLVADTLALPMRVVGDALFGSDTRKVRVAIADVDLPVMAATDIILKDECGTFYVLGKHLWMYLEMLGDDAVLYVFDATQVGITTKNIAEFGAKSTRNTLIKLRPAVKAAYVFKQEFWSKLDAKDLDSYLPEQSRESFSPGTQAVPLLEGGHPEGSGLQP